MCPWWNPLLKITFPIVLYSSVAHMANHPWKAEAAGHCWHCRPGLWTGSLGRCRGTMLLIPGKEDRNQGATIEYVQGKCQTSCKTNLHLWRPSQLELLEEWLPIQNHTMQRPAWKEFRGSRVGERFQCGNEMPMAASHQSGQPPP